MVAVLGPLEVPWIMTTRSCQLHFKFPFKADLGLATIPCSGIVHNPTIPKATNGNLWEEKDC